jgi:hypothetical protein
MPSAIDAGRFGDRGQILDALVQRKQVCRRMRDAAAAPVPPDEAHVLRRELDGMQVGAVGLVDRVDFADHPTRHPDERGPDSPKIRYARRTSPLRA